MCPDAIQAPEGTNLQITNYPTGSVPVGENLHFGCQGKMKFRDDFYQERVEAKCNGGQNYSLPSYWGQCVNGILYLN